jgi:hypothetical protein
MRKGKVGLQKEISRIFTGIQMPPKKDAPETAARPAAPAPTPTYPVAPATTPVPTHPVAPAPVPPPARPVTPAPAPTPTHPVTPAPMPTPARPVAPAPAPTPTRPVTPAPMPTPAAVSHPAPPVVAPPPPAKPAPTLAAPAAPAQTPPKQTTPRPAPSTPHLFTIPEPPQHTEHPSERNVYQKPVPISNVYEPPVIKQNVYEPPTLLPPLRADAKIGQTSNQPFYAPLLKILQRIQEKLPAGENAGRQRIMILLMPVLFVVFIVVISKMLRAPAVQPGPVPSISNAPGSQAGVAFDGKINWEMPPVYPDNLRNPTVMGAVAAQGNENAGRPPVKGIVYSDDNPCAVIGERIVSVGEVVQGATVVKINPENVEFEMGDKKWTQEVER